MGIKVREAKAGELKDVAKLQNKLERYEKRFDKKLKIHKPKALENYLKEKVLKKRRGKIFVAIDADMGGVVGFCSGWVEKAEYSIHNKIGYVSDLYIEKTYRRRGIATKLMKSLLKWFKSKKLRCVYVEAYLRNTPGIKAYKKSGFKEIETTLRKVI